MKLIQAWKTRGLIQNYIFATVSAGIVMGIIFLIVNFTLTSSAISSTRQSNEVIFRQTVQQLASFEDDIDNLYSNLVYNSVLTSYLQADSLDERMSFLEDFRGIVASNRKINPNILTISLYSLDGELIASKGDVFIFCDEAPSSEKRIRYSGILSKDGASYFQVSMKVYADTGRRYEAVGSVCLLLNTSELQNILSTSLVNEESGVALLDQNGELIAGAGIWEDGYRDQENEDCIVFTETLPSSGWTLISRTPESSLIKGSSELQNLSFLIFGAALLVLFYLGISVYRHVIRPIYAQTRFIETFKEDTNQRIHVIEHNEIGQMAQALNQMLDDMEELNKEIVRTQCRNLELDYQKKQMEMLACKNQLNPHFLYNTFDCIRGMALYHQETEIAQLIQSLSALFRYSIKGDEMVSVKEAAGQLERYKTIIEYRFMGKYEIILSVPDETASMKMPKMLLQPLVENAILHGLEESRSGKEVRVIFTREEEGCRISVEDDGVGMSAEVLRHLREQMENYDTDQYSPNETHGIGILNVYRRLKLFYGEKALFTIDSIPEKGTVITLFIPDEEVR